MIVCENLVKIYKTQDSEVLALQGLDLVVESGEMIAVIGSSGSGKSTLLNMLGGLDKPSAGKLYVNGQDLFKMTERELMQYKRDTVGFVWQNSARNVIPYLSAVENVELPMQLRGKADRARATELLETVGLGDKIKKRPAELSGGEQQRVAIAISLANNPKILLADEPTGAVDTATASELINAFRMIKDKFGTTIVIVTHDRKLAGGVDRVVEIRDGRTSSEYIRRQIDVEDVELNLQTHNQYTVVDKHGRLQLPAEIMEIAGIKDKSMVKVEYRDDAIIITRN
jgi:ABC-type lipoprotein export system ATPase subunit